MADTLRVQVQELKIDTTITKHGTIELLEHILRKIDPDSAERIIKDSKERQAELIKDLKEDIKKANGKR